MSYPDPVSRWRETIATAFPHLSRPQATVLALWSYGMVLARSCGITLVCATLALQLGRSEASLVQRLREWCYAAKDKQGSKRQELEVSMCFAPLLRWLLSWWPSDPRDAQRGILSNNVARFPFPSLVAVLTATREMLSSANIGMGL